MKKLNNRNFGPYFGAPQCSVANDPSLPLTHLARGLCIAIIAAWIGCAPQAKAITFAGTTSGIFVNPTGPSGMSASGVGTYDFRWGVPYQSFSSRLVFGGAGFANILPDQYFNLGTLWYINGTAWGGTEAYSVDLRANLTFTSHVGLSEDFDFDFALVNTPNFGTTWQNADSVFLTSFFPATTFNVDGIDYTLQMRYGSVTGGSPAGSGFTVSDQFFVAEGGWASAQLIGMIKPVSPPPSVPDAGSTLALMAIAVVGVGGLRQYLTCKA